MRRALCLGLLLSACVSPGYEDCALACGEAKRCPSSLVCDGDGWCRIDKDAPACPGITPEDPDAARVPDARPPDAAPCVCEPFSAGCCGSGNACDIVAPGEGLTCRPIGTSAMQGSPCQNATECALAHSCIEEPTSGSSGLCHRFCEDEADCEGTGAACALDMGFGLRTCTIGCDPMTSTGCATGFGCALFHDPEAERSFTDCRVAGSRDRGEDCDAEHPCRRGHFCRGDDDRECVAYCRRGASANDCGKRECKPLLGTPVVVGGVEYGYCGDKDDDD